MENRKQWRRSRYFLYRLGRISPDRAVELVLVILALCFTWAQIHITNKNNEGNTDQTNQLIAAAKYSAYAADQNAQASRNFAQSARGINQGVSDAVDRLQDQAAATQAATESAAEASRKALQTTINNFRAEQRPWVDISNIGELDEKDAHNVSVEVANFGKSPALQFRSIIELVTGNPAGHLPLFDVSAEDFGPPGTLGQGATDTLTLENSLSAEQVKELNDPQFSTYLLVRIRYKDYWNKQYDLKFCQLYRVEEKLWEGVDSPDCKEK